MDIFDVVVAGAGPAGFALASECSQRGLRTLCIDPSIKEDWKNIYACWLDEIIHSDISIPIAHQWSKVNIYIDENRSHTRECRYVLVDNILLKKQLKEHFLSSSGKIITDQVNNLTSRGNYTDITLNSANHISAKIVVDATGQQSQLIKRKDRRNTCSAQRAYGILAIVKKHPFSPESAILMDFRNTDGISYESPTFLYVMPLNEHRLFIEETSLIKNPPISMQELESRLKRKIQNLHIHLEKIEKIEYCHIDMNFPLPTIPQEILSFGAAASMVHPATGYSIAYSLNIAPTIANIIAENLSHSDANPELVTTLVWNTLWSNKKKYHRKFFLFGADFLCQLNMNETRDFFHAFFKNKLTVQNDFFFNNLTLLSILHIGWTMVIYLPMKLSCKIIVHFFTVLWRQRISK